VAAKRLDPDSEQGGLDAVLPLFPSAFRELLSATGLTTRDCAGLAISTCGRGFRADANSFQPQKMGGRAGSRLRRLVPARIFIADEDGERRADGVDGRSGMQELDAAATIWR
jgi:hypothetical protein